MKDWKYIKYIKNSKRVKDLNLYNSQDICPMAYKNSW